MNEKEKKEEITRMLESHAKDVVQHLNWDVNDYDFKYLGFSVEDYTVDVEFFNEKFSLQIAMKEGECEGATTYWGEGCSPKTYKAKFGIELFDEEEVRWWMISHGWEQLAILANEMGLDWWRQEHSTDGDDIVIGLEYFSIVTDPIIQKYKLEEYVIRKCLATNNWDYIINENITIEEIEKFKVNWAKSKKYNSEAIYEIHCDGYG